MDHNECRRFRVKEGVQIKEDVWAVQSLQTPTKTTPEGPEGSNDSLCWPEALLPGIVSNCRIMTWGYDADVVHFFRPAGSNTTFQHAQNLLVELERFRRGPNEVSAFARASLSFDR